MIICVCGKSGSGKSTLSMELKKIYIDKLVHIDIDQIAHNVLNDNIVKKELVETFGNNILTNDFIDRKKLGLIVFNSKERMDKLSNITWKFMKLKIDEIIENNKDKIIILDYLLIYKTDYFKNSDLKILIDVPYEVRRDRCMLRDNISEEEFNLREQGSIDFNEDDFDYILKDINEIKKVKIYE